MHTFLRHARTGEYFKSLGRWTLDRDDAFDFGMIARAVKFAHKAGFPGLELVLSFDDPEQAPSLSFEKFRLGRASVTHRKALPA
jgi:hypothetical protein